MNIRFARQACHGLAALGACCAATLAPAADLGAEATAMGQRFELRAEHSRFDVGANAQDRSEGPYRRVVGERGAFFVDTLTGASLGVLSAPAAAKGLQPAQPLPQGLTDDPARHSAEVARYLLAAGVPAAEVRGTHVTATMGGGGPVEDGVRPAQSSLLWYTTHLERSLAGIPVEGSFAFAALDQAGKAISEGVFWPEIPADVVRRAVLLRQRLESADGARSYLALVRQARPDLGDGAGEVRIVHTGAGHHGAFEAQAVYSVVLRPTQGGKAQILRFDAEGAPVRLADERKSASDQPKQR